MEGDEYGSFNKSKNCIRMGNIVQQEGQEALIMLMNYLNEINSSGGWAKGFGVDPKMKKQ